MDPQRFDTLARSIAAPKSRRSFFTALAALGAGLLGARGAGRAGAQVSQAYCGDVSCRTNPSRCKEGCVCCVWPNKNSRCMPPGKCSGTVACAPGLRFCPGLGRCAACCADGDCDDGNACTTSVCTGGACVHSPVVCDDGFGLCTTKTCDPATGCVFTEVACDEGGPCVEPVCLPQTGCSYVFPVPPGQPGGCTDGQVCCPNAAGCTTLGTVTDCSFCGAACSGTLPICHNRTCVGCVTDADCASPLTCGAVSPGICG